MLASLELLGGISRGRVAPADAFQMLRPMAPAAPECRFDYRASPGSDEQTLDVARSLVDLCELLIHTLTTHQARQLLVEVRTLVEDSRTKIDPEYFRYLVGKEPPSHGQQVERRVRGLLRAFERRRSMLADSLLEEHLYRFTRIRPNREGDWTAKPRKLLAIDDFGQWRFPTFQFDPDAPDGLIFGLADVLDVLERVPIFNQLAWFTTKQVELDGLEPWRVLRQGQRERVRALARAYARTFGGQPDLAS